MSLADVNGSEVGSTPEPGTRTEGNRSSGFAASDDPSTQDGTGGRLIYSDLAIHQGSEKWFGRDLAVALQIWADRFGVEFKLDIPELALRIDDLSRSRFGHFRYGHNGFGLRGEIALNARYLTGQREMWRVLGTLLHEMLHAWQQAKGTPGKGNYHNRQFREKALTLGLAIDRQGVTEYVGGSPFFKLLAGHDITVPSLSATPPPEIRAPGQSKMKKWCCNCTKIRCATDLVALCFKCNQEFRRAL